MAQQDSRTPRVATHPKPRVFQSAEGSSAEDFELRDWATLVAIALIWGSSFVLMDIALEDMHPATIAAARVVFGTLTLTCFAAARTPLPADARTRTAFLGIIWIAVPLAMFPLAQQWITSSLAGIINGGVPIFAGLWAAILLRRLPPRRQRVGLAIGFAGVATVSLPSALGNTTVAGVTSGEAALGIGLLLFAITLYGLSLNLAVPLQQEYGALPVLWRAQLAACVVIVPYGLLGVADSSFTIAAVGALLPLGILGTGAAFVLMATLAGRVGGERASIAIYFVPMVAVVLGVSFRSDPITASALAGLAMVIVGARLASRGRRAPALAPVREEST